MCVSVHVCAGDPEARRWCQVSLESLQWVLEQNSFAGVSKHLTTEPSLQNSILLFEPGCQDPSVSTIQVLGLQAAVSKHGC